MIQNRIWAVFLASILIFSLTACGGSKGENTNKTTAISEEAQKQVVEKLAEEAAQVPVPDTAAAAAADKAAAENEAETSSIEKLLGEWTDINDAARLVKITENDGQFVYENADGKYQGSFKDGVLTIKVSDNENDTAMVFIDVKTGNMVTNYQGDIYEFSRKIG